MAIARYQKKISGPLLDRFDIHVEVPRVDYEKLAGKRQVEDSKTIRARVQAARERQLERFKGAKLTCNAEMGPTEVREFCSYVRMACCSWYTTGDILSNRKPSSFFQKREVLCPGKRIAINLLPSCL